MARQFVMLHPDHCRTIGLLGSWPDREDGRGQDGATRHRRSIESACWAHTMSESASLSGTFEKSMGNGGGCVEEPGSRTTPCSVRGLCPWPGETWQDRGGSGRAEPCRGFRLLPRASCADDARVQSSWHLKGTMEGGVSEERGVGRRVACNHGPQRVGMDTKLPWINYLFRVPCSDGLSMGRGDDGRGKREEKRGERQNIEKLPPSTFCLCPISPSKELSQRGRPSMAETCPGPLDMLIICETLFSFQDSGSLGSRSRRLKSPTQVQKPHFNRRLFSSTSGTGLPVNVIMTTVSRRPHGIQTTTAIRIWPSWNSHHRANQAPSASASMLATSLSNRLAPSEQAVQLSGVCNYTLCTTTPPSSTRYSVTNLPRDSYSTSPAWGYRITTMVAGRTLSLSRCLFLPVDNNHSPRRPRPVSASSSTETLSD